jgi:hypothetical protein
MAGMDMRVLIVSMLVVGLLLLLLHMGVDGSAWMRNQRPSTAPPY